MNLLRYKKQADTEVRENLLKAVVSLYLFMARNARLHGKEINFIDRLLRSMLGNDIPLYQIEQACQKVQSVREAANFLNHHLGVSERSLIVLTLVSLAYHERSKVHVLGNVEIVELTDLLRLDPNSLDILYDLFEGRADTLKWPMLLQDKANGFLRSSMKWGGQHADFRFEQKEPNLELDFLMIEDLLLVHTSHPNAHFITDGKQTRELLPKVFHRLKDGYRLLINTPNLALDISCADIWQIYRQRNSKQSIESLLNQNTAKSNKNIELTDYYIDIQGSGIIISQSQSSRSIGHFSHGAAGWTIEAISSVDIYLNRNLLNTAEDFTLNNDSIGIEGRNYIVNRNWELIEIPLEIRELTVNDIHHQFKNGHVGLSGISFTLNQGNMMAMMGPSGSGKTTLLQVLLGEIVPTRSNIMIDGLNLSDHLAFFQKYIGYVPQDDLLFANLTVFENLYFKLRMSLPKIHDRREIYSRIENLLHSVGLYEQRNMIVGDVMNKKLSGGQRRRLNIALELVMGPMIIILDEPTSGLSSKDSENIIEFLSELKDQGKIIICSIHQPNAAIFKRFDRILLMDRGGVEVFFGNGTEVFDYFDDEIQRLGSHSDEYNLKKQLWMPELFFDILEYADEKGKRIFPPEYWEQKYRDRSFRRLIDSSSPVHDSTILEREEQSNTVHYSFSNFLLLIRRNFLNKMRSKLNLLMTVLVAPLLAFLTAFVLRGVPDGMAYSFYENLNAPLFDFISIIIFIFIGLANSIDDILSEKRIIQREKKMNVSALCQLNAKHFVLLIMTIIQVLLYYYISAGVLGMRGFLVPKAGILLLTGITGYTLGLFFSAFIRERAAIINILPLIIIPQIMFSGAVIRFQDMNDSLKINRHHEIPEFCQLVPSRWLFEGITIASAQFNAFSRYQHQFNEYSLNAMKNPHTTFEDYSRISDANALYQRIHPESMYQNKLTNMSTNLAHGQYKNRQQNTFMSYRTTIFHKEMDTIKLDLLIIFSLIGLAWIATLLKLKYWY